MKLNVSVMMAVAAVVLLPFSFSARADHHEKGEHHEHGKHSHAHKKNCGHKAEKHGDHEDYEHDGHHHKGHAGHVDECAGPEHAAPAGQKS